MFIENNSAAEIGWLNSKIAAMIADLGDTRGAVLGGRNRAPRGWPRSAHPTRRCNDYQLGGGEWLGAMYNSSPHKPPI